MPYTVRFKPSAEKAFAKLTQSARKQLAPKISELETDAKPIGSKPLEGYKLLRRMRSGDYRLVYRLPEPDNIIWVLVVGDRKDIYRDLDRLGY